MFPVNLDLTDRPVLVVGGGPVGRRKATAATSAGSVITVVDPAEPVAGPWTWVRAEYQPAHLDGVWLAFACAPPDVNAQVLADAAARRVWASDASDPGWGGFTLPAVGRTGRLTVAVSTGGASPGLARVLCDELTAHLTPADAAWADLLAELRLHLTVEQRRALADPAWRARVAAEGIDAVRAAIERLPNTSPKR